VAAALGGGCPVAEVAPTVVASGSLAGTPARTGSPTVGRAGHSGCGSPRAPRGTRRGPILPLIGLAGLVGLDNLRIGAGLGLAGLPPRRRLQMAAAFGAVEGAMPLVGVGLGSAWLPAAGELADYVGAAALAICGLAAIAGVVAPRTIRILPGSRWLVVALPLALGFDNVLAGIGLAGFGVPIPVAVSVVGGLSGAMAFAGLYLGAVARGIASPAAGVLGCVSLVSAAVLILIR
jgi:putative Mn2+ efflux pump MntP